LEEELVRKEAIAENLKLKYEQGAVENERKWQLIFDSLSNKILNLEH
jgi:hypothetical protein